MPPEATETPVSLQEQLHALFLLDKQVRGMRARLDVALSRTKAQAGKRGQLQQQRDELAAQLKQVQAKASGFEHEANGLEERITKLRGQMNSVTSHKEYQALVVEVNTLKADKGKLEEQALEQLTQVDAIQAKIGEVDAKIAERGKLETQSQGEVDSARSEVGERLDQLTAERDAAATQLPEDIQKQFRKLADEYEGEALAEVEEQSRRHMEYTCGGCYMSIPVERVNAVMSKPNVVTTCPNCGRILYASAELKSAIGSK